MKVFCVIPAWNEATHIVQTINDVLPYVDEVIVVDDCSSDATRALAQSTPATVLHHVVNRYQGGALRTGTNYVLAQTPHPQDIIVHFDADGQMRAQDIATVILPLQQGQADICFGSRFLDNSTHMPAFKKQVIMPIARLVNRLWGIKLTDPQSGFRAFSVDTATKLKFYQDGMAHCSEIMVEAHRLQLRIAEVPITVLYHEFGQSFSGGLKIIKDIVIGKIIK